MKQTIGIMLLLLTLVSCNSNTPESFCGNSEIIDERISFVQKVADEILNRHDVVQLGGSRPLNDHISRVNKMIQKVQAHYQEKDLIDFTEEYNFFNQTERYNCSFFTKKHMNCNEALFIIDQLLYEIRNSELGNDYFKYLSVEFEFKQKGDELSFEYRPEQLLKSYFLGPKDSCTNERFTKKHEKTYWHGPIDLSSFRKGDTITGGIAMQKMNHPVYIPFEYIKK